MMMQLSGGVDMKPKWQPQGLHRNAHIPGYKGHCPRIEQVVGRSFAESSKISYLMHKEEQGALNNTYKNRNSEKIAHNISIKANNASINNNYNNTVTSYNTTLPSYNNYNRYTNNMISGYTGYIPNQASGFGKTFTETSNMRLKEHFRNIETYKQEDKEKEREGERERVERNPQLQEVERQMNAYLRAKSDDKHLNQDRLQPIGGYSGHVPRKQLSEGSVGRVHEKATRQALQTFHKQHADYSSTLASHHNNQPVTCHCK